MKKASIGAAITMLAVLVTAFAGWTRSEQNATQTQRVPQFENEDVNVRKSVVFPHQPLTMHRHDHPRVFIASEAEPWRLWTSVAQENRMSRKLGKLTGCRQILRTLKHADVNTGDQPIEVMVVELTKEK